MCEVSTIENRLITHIVQPSTHAMRNLPRTKQHLASRMLVAHTLRNHSDHCLVTIRQESVRLNAPVHGDDNNYRGTFAALACLTTPKGKPK